MMGASTVMVAVCSSVTHARNSPVAPSTTRTPCCGSSIGDNGGGGEGGGGDGEGGGGIGGGGMGGSIGGALGGAGGGGEGGHVMVSSKRPVVPVG